MSALWAKAKWYAIGAAMGLALLGAAYGAGRYAVPTKTVEVTKTQFVDRVVTAEVTREVKVSGPVRIQEKIIERPGAERIIERIIERGSTTTTTGTATASSGESTGSTSTTKTVEMDRPRYRLELSQDVTKATDPKQIGGAASIRVLGPVWLGVAVPTAEDWQHPRATLGVEF